MRFKTLILLILFARVSAAQTGGDNTYEFLNLSTHSLITSLGGINVSILTDDPGLAFYNPALLNNEADGSASLSYVNYLAGINYGHAAYSVSHQKYGSFSGGITYLNYGNFEKTDPSGNIIGSFKASEYAINIIWSFSIDSLFTVGVNLKPIVSHLESYNSFGFALDFGGHYRSRNGLFTSGLVIRNLGAQLTTYTGIRDNLPFEIVAGASTRLEHAPFRFSLTIRHLEKYDLTHEYNLDRYSNTDDKTINSGLGENIMRHMLIAMEFIPSDNFFISSGFNYQRRKELIVDNRGSTVGFSLGAGIKLSGLELTFSRSKYHLAGSATNISLLLKPSLLKFRN